MLKKLTNYLLRYFLVTLYKVFIRPDYADVISDKPNNMNIYDKIESLQYDAALAITGVIRGSSKENLYQELGFEYLSSRRLFRKLCLFYKIVVNKLPNYFLIYVATSNQSYQTRRSSDKILYMWCRKEYFTSSFFPCTVKEYDNLI